MIPRHLLSVIRDREDEQAATQLNALIDSLAASDPYVLFGGKMRPACIHCGKKFDMGEGENNIPAQHEESCLWFYCWKLVSLIKMWNNRDGSV